MVREEIEKVITEKIRDIYADYKRYNPTGQYLNMVVIEDNAIMFWDGEQKINHYEKL